MNHQSTAYNLLLLLIFIPIFMCWNILERQDDIYVKVKRLERSHQADKIEFNVNSATY